MFVSFVNIVFNEKENKMSVIGKDNTASVTNSPSNATAYGTNPRPAQAAPATQQSGGGWSFHGTPFGLSPIGRSPGSESLGRLQAQLIERFKDADKAFEFTLLPIDNANEALHYSVLVVCLRMKQASNDNVAFHTLIVEATGEPLTPVNQQISGQNIEVLRTPGAAYDNNLIKKVESAVQRQFPAIPLLTSQATIVPRDFNLDDKNAVHALAVNTALALSTELQVRASGFKDFNLVEQAHDSKLQVNLSFSNQQIVDAVGYPVRADVGVKMLSQIANKARDNSVNSDDRAVVVSDLHGFVDLIYSPVNQQNNGFANIIPQGVVNTQQYSARYVITDLSTNYACTPAVTLMAITNAQALADSTNWAQVFRQSPQAQVRNKSNRVNTRDIGAIGIETPLAAGQELKKIDTATASFGPTELGQLLGMTFRPGLVISMDVGICAPNYWQSNIFSAAAEGNANATNALIAYANQLTNGNFSKNFQGGNLFTDAGNYVHTGYYVGEDGLRYDLRDCDYLAVANFAAVRNDPLLVRGWSDTFTRVGFPLEQRLAARKNYIQGFYPSAVFTGFAHRVTFSAEFLRALTAGCADAGMSLSINAGNAVDLNNQRGVGSFVEQALLPNSGNNMFRPEAPVGGVGFGTFGNNQFGARW